MSPKQRAIIVAEIENMLKVRVIGPSNSSRASRLLVVEKVDGTWRPCIDYRRSNEFTIQDCYPLPVIEDVLQRVSKGKISTQIDLYAGFWQLGVNENNIKKLHLFLH